jgi:hypothetical protein
MAGAVNYELLNTLQPGDVIAVSNRGVIEHHTLVKLKRVNADTTYNGSSFNVPFSLIKSLVKKFDPQEKFSEVKNEIQDLKVGAPIWFDSNGKCLVIYFEKFEKGKIYGKSPSGQGWKVDPQFYGGKIEVP